MLLYFVVGSSTLAAIFGLLAFLGARSRTDPTEKILLLVHEAFDRVRSLLAEQNRGLREELTNNLRGFQTASLQAFTDLGRQLGDQARESGATLASGLRTIDEPLASLREKLDHGLDQILAQSVSGREALERTVAARLGKLCTS